MHFHFNGITIILRHQIGVKRSESNFTGYPSADGIIYSTSLWVMQFQTNSIYLAIDEDSIDAFCQGDSVTLSLDHYVDTECQSPRRADTRLVNANQCIEGPFGAGFMTMECVDIEFWGQGIRYIIYADSLCQTEIQYGYNVFNVCHPPMENMEPRIRINVC